MSTHQSNWNYNTGGFTNPSVQPGLEQKFIEIIGRAPSADLACDLGCGNGRLAGSIASMGWNVVGVDNSVSGIEMAKQHNQGKLVNFICEDIDSDLPKKLKGIAGEFDLVFSSDVIEHLYRPAVLIETAFRILKPQGLLVVGAPYHGYFKNLAISLVSGWDKHNGVNWDGGHIKFFSTKTLGAMIRSRGFEVLSFRYFGRAPLLWNNMICVAKKINVAA